MTVEELIEKLKEVPPHGIVRMGSAGGWTVLRVIYTDGTAVLKSDTSK